MKSEINRPAPLKKIKSVNAVLMKYLLLLAFLLIVLVEVICYFIVSNTSKDQANERLMHAGRDVVNYINGNDEGGVSAYIRLYRQEGINVFVLSPDGKILLPSDEVTEDGVAVDMSVIVKRLGGVESQGSVLFIDNNRLNYATTVNYDGGSYVLATYSLRLLSESLRVLIIYFCIVGVIVLLVAALISYSISQKLSSGLKNLSTTAGRFSKGDFDAHFANAEYQELATLSDTLNSVRDEVKKSGDFQRELVANVSHDLKTPLTMIKAYASMIREISGNDPEKRDKHLQVIIDEADRLTGLVNDVLSVSKVSSKLDALNLKVFNLTEFLYGIINKFDYLQETQGYNFMVDIDAELYTRADAEKIGQVIYNLLGNAVNYTGEDKTVYISLKSSLTDDRIRFSVKDTGKGISKDDLPEIWNRYYRVEENHSRPVKGTGLGLNIVKIILQNHSFDFGVESDLGKGSIFWVDFPSVPKDIEIAD
ncbi:MAG: HAMP domain-containing histidine kinase [Clostridia bacterium]|nr:HAMP domain-containing histidine kinase [Clostridia bacterium]